jgi:amicyanin
MTRAFKMLTFQAATLATAGLMMSTVAAMSRAAPAPAAAQVAIANFTLTAPVTTVKAGTTVTWTNADDIPHTVDSTTKAFKSGALDTDQAFSFTFTTPGSYKYFCALHPHMTGLVVVEAATGSNAPR